MKRCFKPFLLAPTILIGLTAFGMMAMLAAERHPSPAVEIGRTIDPGPGVPTNDGGQLEN